MKQRAGGSETLVFGIHHLPAALYRFHAESVLTVPPAQGTGDQRRHRLGFFSQNICPGFYTMFSRIAAARNSLSFATAIYHTRPKLCLQAWRTYTSRNILKLEERGLWADFFPDNNVNKLIQELTRKPQTIYSGFDPTADSLHVGNLLVIMALLHCQRAGHNVIALVGGATAQIGDPSGRKSERPQLSVTEIQDNSQKIFENLNRVFSNHKEYFWENEDKSPLPPMRQEELLTT
ncbi:Tyrosine--tRNA ligase, mitochondrial [Portunus trituberculatus]|uniref:Tyrosine--tRNA ligase, mitochondrial n=1 Tax=Portunus trituberculatus TaxID=210409 RepID=A0A5B7EJ25_PORTR|nr:Tyrosine--tRNA ligase, mitochondrial [Portunus trituberculatus]